MEAFALIKAVHNLFLHSLSVGISNLHSTPREARHAAPCNPVAPARMLPRGRIRRSTDVGPRQTAGAEHLHLLAYQPRTVALPVRDRSDIAPRENFDPPLRG